MDERSNTTPKQGGITGKGFVKGDPRINRKGRPKSFDALRALALAIAHEKAKTKDGETLTVEGHAVSVVEAILRQWAMGKDKKQQKDFLEIGFGKVPDQIDITSGGHEIDIREVIVELPGQNDPATVADRE